MSETINRTMNWPVIYRLIGICFIMSIVDRFLTSITPSEIHQDISWVSGWIACGWFYQTWRLRFGKPKGE